MARVLWWGLLALRKERWPCGRVGGSIQKTSGGSWRSTAISCVSRLRQSNCRLDASVCGFVGWMRLREIVRERKRYERWREALERRDS